VQADQRGRARGVDGDRRADQAEHVGDPAGAGRRCGAGVVVAAEVLVAGHHQRAVVVAVDAGEHAGLAAAQRERVDAGVLQRLPGDLQELALLRAHRQRFPWADTEEACVEVGDVGQEAAAARPRRVEAEPVRQRVPAAVGRVRTGRVDAVGDQAPQLVGAVRGRVPAAHADDGDRFRLPGLQLAQLLAGPVQIRRDPLEVLEELVVGHLSLTNRVVLLTPHRGRR
jgi:hypothetical protein